MKLRRISWLTALVIVAVIAYAIIALMNMRTKVAAATETVTQLQTQVDQLQEEIAALQYALANKDDPKTWEDIARDELDMVTPEEKIFYDSGQ